MNPFISNDAVKAREHEEDDDPALGNEEEANVFEEDGDEPLSDTEELREEKGECVNLRIAILYNLP